MSADPTDDLLAAGAPFGTGRHDAPSAETSAGPTLVPGQLTEGWRWIFALGWSLVAPALMAIGDASHSLGKPTWWLNDAGTVAWWTPLAFVPIVLAAAAGAFNWRTWPFVGVGAAASLGAWFLIDRGTTPNVALAEAGLALAGLATTLAAFAGRVRLRGN